MPLPGTIFVAGRSFSSRCVCVCVSVGQEHNRTSNIYTMLTVCSERRNSKPEAEESVCFLYEQVGTLTG